MSKAEAAQAAALNLLGVGAREQSTRMPPKPPKAEKPRPIQINIQLSHEGLEMLQRARVVLLQRGVPRASFRGVTLETVLKEWLGKETE